MDSRIPTVMATATVSPAPKQSFFSTYQEHIYTWPTSSSSPTATPTPSIRVVHHEIPPSDNDKRDAFSNILNVNNEARSEKGDTPASSSIARPPLLSILQEGLEKDRLKYQSAITAKPTRPYRPAFTPTVSVIALPPPVLGITPVLTPHVPEKEKGSINVPKTGHWWPSSWGKTMWANIMKKEPGVKEWYEKNRDELDTIQKWKNDKKETVRIVSEMLKTSKESKHDSVLQKIKDFFKLKVPGFKRDTSALDEKQIFAEILGELGFAGTIEDFQKNFILIKEAEKEKFFELVVEKLGSSAIQPGPVVVSGPIPSTIREKLVVQENGTLTVSTAISTNTDSLAISKREVVPTIAASPTLTGFYTHTRPIHTYWSESIETSLETWATFPSITLVRTHIQTASYLRITDVTVLTTTTTITPTPTPSTRTLTSTSHTSQWTTITAARPIPMPMDIIPTDKSKDINTAKAKDHTLKNFGFGIGVTIGVALLILILVFAVKKCKSGKARKTKAASARSNADLEGHVSEFFNTPLQNLDPSNRPRR